MHSTYSSKHLRPVHIVFHDIFIFVSSWAGVRSLCISRYGFEFSIASLWDVQPRKDFTASFALYHQHRHSSYSSSCFSSLILCSIVFIVVWLAYIEIGTKGGLFKMKRLWFVSGCVITVIFMRMIYVVFQFYSVTGCQSTHFTGRLSWAEWRNFFVSGTLVVSFIFSFIISGRIVRQFYVVISKDIMQY